MGLFVDLNNKKEIPSSGEQASKAAGFSGANGQVFTESQPVSVQSVPVGGFMVTPSLLLGGITPREAIEIHEQIANTHYSHKNLFLIEITDISGSADIGPVFNLFCADVSYESITIPSDRTAIGSASMDGVRTTEHVEMSITTLDDSHGTIKRWFAGKAAKVASPDGLVGLPIDYLVKIRVLHAFIADESSAGGYEDIYLMRPVSQSNEFSRSDDSLQELQLVFTQFDTFFPA